MSAVLSWIELAGGAAITLVTLADIFVAILVPGPSRGWLRVSARVGRAMLPLARYATRRSGTAPGERPSNIYAPLAFLLSFITWLLLLLLGFGLMFHAEAAAFTPRVAGLGDAFWIAGCSLLTLGVSEFDAAGPARALILVAAASGFAAITATISYILQIQSALAQRETRVLTLGTLAGSPPSGIHLLEASAELHASSELFDFFRQWRDWSASVLHSHVASPVLIFFHSVDSEGDWLAALEAVLDAATLLIALTTDEGVGAATLMHRAGSRTAARLAVLLRVEEEKAPPLDGEAIAALVERLRASGYTVREGSDLAERFCRLRADYAGRIAGIARLIGADRTLPLDV